MLGKASEIKIKSFNYQIDYDQWAEEHPEFLIIDIKFQAEQEGSILLIIYKEPNQRPEEAI